MSSASVARQQKALEAVILLPGNQECADCQARPARWASTNLGIFLCERCAGLHRKLGTHITKIKSVSFDSWDKQNVEQMKRIGNARSNALYNPRNDRPATSFDPDDAGRAMEQFIRQKYEKRTFVKAGAATDLMT